MKGRAFKEYRTLFESPKENPAITFYQRGFGTKSHSNSRASA
jgi:hypothetical protein